MDFAASPANLLVQQFDGRPSGNFSLLPASIARGRGRFYLGVLHHAYWRGELTHFGRHVHHGFCMLGDAW